MKNLFFILLSVFVYFNTYGIPSHDIIVDSVIDHQTKNSNISISGMKGLKPKSYTIDDMPDDFGFSNKPYESSTPFTGPMGHYLPKEFGESKYDKDISVAELMQTGDLEKLRDRERTAEVTKVLNYVIGLILIGFVIFLGIRS